MDVRFISGDGDPSGRPFLEGEVNVIQRARPEEGLLLLRCALHGVTDFMRAQWSAKAMIVHLYSALRVVRDAA